MKQKFPDKNKQDASLYFLIIFLLFFSLNSVGQVNPKKDIKRIYDVLWKASFNSADDFPKKKSFASQLFDFVVGKEKEELVRPISLTVTEDGLIDVLDQGRNALVHIDYDQSSVNSSTGTDNQVFSSLVGSCLNNQNQLLFTDSRLNKIFIRKTVASEAVLLNSTLELNQPTGIAFNKITNQIWVVETAAHSITVLSSTGVFIKKIGQRGTGPGEFNFPTFIWIDNIGTVYVVDSMNFRLQIISNEGVVQSMFGEAGDATGFFARPKGVATDSNNNIYIVDALFHTVQIFDQQGHFLHNFGKQGKNNGEFWMPSGIFIDQSDRIYVADSYNARIQIFELSEKDQDGFNEN